MKDVMKKPGAIIAICAVLIAALAFGTVMIARNAMATNNPTIGIAKAKEIALNHAKLKENDVTFTKSSIDSENAKKVYELDFYTDTTEYEYEINAETGNISKQTKEARSNKHIAGNGNANGTHDGLGNGNGSGNGNGNGNGNGYGNGDGSGNGYGNGNSDQCDYIGVAKAKSIALANAGLSASQVTFSKSSLSHDDGVAVYEIEFYRGNNEYEYEINATTGAIIEKSTDVDDHDDDD